MSGEDVEKDSIQSDLHGVTPASGGSAPHSTSGSYAAPSEEGIGSPSEPVFAASLEKLLLSEDAPESKKPPSVPEPQYSSERTMDINEAIAIVSEANMIVIPWRTLEHTNHQAPEKTQHRPVEESHFTEQFKDLLQSEIAQGTGNLLAMLKTANQLGSGNCLNQPSSLPFATFDDGMRWTLKLSMCNYDLEEYVSWHEDTNVPYLEIEDREDYLSRLEAFQKVTSHKLTAEELQQMYQDSANSCVYLFHVDIDSALKQKDEDGQLEKKQSKEEKLCDPTQPLSLREKPQSPITDTAERVRFRTERQSLRRLPRSGAIVFTIRSESSVVRVSTSFSSEIVSVHL